MAAERDLVLLARAVTPLRRLALAGGSAWDRVYTALNQLVAALLIALLSPLLAYIAYRIWRVDGTPVTFAHGRIGGRGKVFRCFKFRSMVRNSAEVLEQVLRDDPQARAEWARDHKLRNDPRITPIGRFLRKTSLDELPQLFNVLRGEMHFVGPRPVTLEEVRRYGWRKRHYLSVKPGLTGLWQVSGRNNTTYEERVQFDTDYVEKRNPLIDLWIVTRTVKVLLTRDGAH
jgi:lipopolysaccharide/colanic/teichoic acid biosynthesis glycosyltransferase